MQTPGVRSAVQVIMREHQQLSTVIGGMQRFVELLDELVGKAALPALRAMVDEYAAFYANHRRLEEEVILPAARKWLTPKDWDVRDEAFGANRDPFFGAKIEEDLGHLFSLIVNSIPEAQV